MFPDVPSMYFLGQIYHDVGVGDAAPVKQHRYRPNAIKQQYHKEEIKYLLADDFIEPSCSGWSSARILVPKPGGGYWMCADYKKALEKPVTQKNSTFQKDSGKYHWQNAPKRFQSL